VVLSSYIPGALVKMPWKKKFNFLNLPEVFSRLVILSRTVTNESNDQLVCHTTHAHHHWHIFRCVRTRTHKSSTDTSCCRIYLEKLSIIISQSNWPRLSLANFRVLEGRSCDHSDKQPDHIISHFNSTSSSAQYIYKINLYYPPTHTHTCTFHVASSLQVSRPKLYTHFPHTSSMSCHFTVLYFNNATVNGPQCIWPISLVTSRTVFCGCRQHINRRYCYLPWDGIHTF
jgi:hypothetical protein